MSEYLATQLPHRGVVRIGGGDRRTFLQGLISNDIELCRPGSAIYAALLTPQGKFLHDLFIIDEQNFFLIDCEAARAEDLLRRLGMYRLRAKVTLENMASEFEVWALWGKNIPASKNEHFYSDPRLSALGARVMVKKGTAPGDGERTDFSIYDKHRLTLGVPDGSRDMIAEKSTPLECNLDRLNAISWTKGCYLGQELTARMHHRGLVKKRLFPVTISGPAPAFGSVVTLNSEDIGDMRSSCEDIGLALLNIEKAQAAMAAKTQAVCGKSLLEPRSLPGS